MTCLALKTKSQLLVLLVVDVAAGAFLPIKDTSFQQRSNGALFSEYPDGFRLFTSTRRFHSLLETASRHSVPRSPVNGRSVYYDNNKHVDLRDHLPEIGTAESLQEYLYLASETKSNGINDDEASAPGKEPHRIKKRSTNSDIINGGRTASDFVFPIKSIAFIPKQDLKNCSEDGTDLCVSNVWDYPHRHIERLLKNTTFHFQDYFTDDFVTVSTRFDSSADEELMCDAEETILYPKFGKTSSNEMLFIINDGGKHRQGVRVEKCKKTGESPCNPKLATPTGYRTYCKQKFIYRKLLALHPNGEPAPDNFRIPSCCSCHISKET